MSYTSKVDTKPQNGSETVTKTITTEVFHTEILKSTLPADQTMKNDFEFSSRNFSDWMDQIERILDEKELNQRPKAERLEIVQEIKRKYISYDEQFKTLIRTGNAKTEQMKEGSTFSK